MKNFKPENFQAVLSLLSKEPYHQNADTAFKFFHKKFQAIVNKHAPFQMLTRKEFELECKPWITKGILISTRVKAKLFKIFKRTKNLEDYKILKFTEILLIR